MAPKELDRANFHDDHYDQRSVSSTDEATVDSNQSPRKSNTKKEMSDPPTRTLSFVSAAIFNPPNPSSLFKQSLVVLAVFVLGICTGVGYVGWVQQHYGFGKDPALEKQYLPFGPTTHQPTLDLLAAQSIALSEQLKKEASKRRKQMLLNRDNPNQRKPLLATLFGVEYGNVIAAGGTDQAQKAPAIEVSPHWYSLASNKQVQLAPSETNMIQDIGQKVHQNIPDLAQRAVQVSWGGPQTAVPETNWWSPKRPNHSNELSALDGGHSLYAYLFIMKWNPHPHFPFRLCGENGCPPERALAHTLQWREVYKPWLAPPSLLEENAKGYSYHRGFSPSDTPGGKHGTVWLRLGHKVKHDLSFFRGILHSGDRAIAEGLIESKGETGKFNVVIDCAGFSLSGTPTLHALKQGVTMLQDHFPNRLGMIFLAHLSRPGEIFLKIVLSLITKEVRDKIKILPNHDKAKSLAILKTVVEEEYIPQWLGGTDPYQFDVESYYPPHLRCSEEEAQEFLQSMPYHAN